MTNATVEKEAEILTQEEVAEETEHYDASVPFDHTVEHSDAYYEEYIAQFEPNKKSRWFYRFVKRSFDLIVSFLMLVILSPVFLIVAIAVKCDSKGPVLFKQKRLGRNEKVFNCYKFRSMRTDAPKNMATSLLENPEQYQTRVGRVLRKLSLDELPQLWCVFVGNMSIIGYRPLILNEAKCNDMRKRLDVFSMRPGISGYAQVYGRDDVYYKNKAVMDSIYVKNASIGFDIKMMFKTVAVVFTREGNDDAKSKDEKK